MSKILDNSPMKQIAFYTARVRSEFDASRIPGNVAVVGVGATGSRVATILGQVGLTDRLVLLDPDVVEEENLCSQEFTRDDVGQLKTTALGYKLLEKWVGRTEAAADWQLLPKEYGTAYDRKHKRGYPYLFVCVDTMAARREIAERCVFLNGVTRLVVDVRITARTVIVIAYDPRDPRQHRQYLDEMYGDPTPEDDAAMGGCGYTPSVASTISIAGGLACQLFFDHVNERIGVPNELVLSMHDWSIAKRSYATSK